MGYDGAVRKPALTGLLVMLVLAGTPAAVLAGKPPSSSCTQPASDLCPDYLWRGSRWSSSPVPFHINSLAAPPGAEQDVLDAFSAWQNETGSPAVEERYPGDGSSIAFAYQGATTLEPVTDGVNTVFFGPSSGGPAYLKTLRIRRGQILEFDIFVNTNHAWTTDLTCPTHNCGVLDLQNVVTPEIGHALDLYHVSDAAQAELTMHPGAAPDELKKRDLGAGEVLALRRIYPA